MKRPSSRSYVGVGEKLPDAYDDGSGCLTPQESGHGQGEHEREDVDADLVVDPVQPGVDRNDGAVLQLCEPGGPNDRVGPCLHRDPDARQTPSSSKVASPRSVGGHLGSR